MSDAYRTKPGNMVRFCSASNGFMTMIPILHGTVKMAMDP